jgi:DNA-binding transcriptional LysR family regulator
MRGVEPVEDAPEPALVADDLTFLVEAARHGLGVAALPSFLAQPEVSAGRLARVLPRWASGAAALWLVHPKLAHPPTKVTAFRDFVVEHLAARPLGPGLINQPG